MNDPVSVIGALGVEGGRVPEAAELIEKIEQLPWRDVGSTNLQRIAWCEIDTLQMRDSQPLVLGWLWVQFHRAPTGSYPDVYCFLDVPECIYLTLLEARSPGKAFGRLVRGHYRHGAARTSTGQTFVELRTR